MQPDLPPEQPIGFIDRAIAFAQSTIGIVLIIGVVASLILPYILTHFYLGISFDNTGQVGDTIGGIAGPILNITGLIIVYLSFQQQLEANNKQWDAFEKEQAKTRREEQFSDIDKAINLLSADVKKHEPTFRAVAQLIERIEWWYAPPDPADFLSAKVLATAVGFTWNNQFIKSPDDLWAMFSKFDWFANYLQSQYDSIISEIDTSLLSDSRRRLLQASLRNQCIIPTYDWLSEETMKKSWDRDEIRFQTVRILAIMNQLRVDTPMIFPTVIHPYEPQND